MNQIMRDPGKRPICVLRAKEAGVARGLAKLFTSCGGTDAGQQLLAEMPARIGLDAFTVVGLLGQRFEAPADAEPFIVDEDGRCIGTLVPGDCFAVFDLDLQRKARGRA